MTIFTLCVGNKGSGTLRITNGGQVDNRYYSYIGDGSGSTGTVTVGGIGSQWTNSFDLYVGREGEGILDITAGGLVSVAETLIIDDNNDGDSFVNITRGGMLALQGDADDSLDDFLALVSGSDAIRWWDDSIDNWALLTTATEGSDYWLEYLTQGDLAGYTLLTVGVVPEPGTLLLLTIGLIALATCGWRKRCVT